MPLSTWPQGNARVNMAAGGGGREKEALKISPHPQLHGRKLESHQPPPQGAQNIHLSFLSEAQLPSYPRV